MSQEMVLKVGEEAIMAILLLITPALGLGLVVGLIISIFQATTQIQEQTLAFIPKIVVILLSFLIFGKWMLSYLITFTNHIFELILQVVM
ncbi:component of the flagellar export machinery [[Clostridium] ultunense Esp]|nr:component of the flagellar export machinery [[Clostridium] ultunense Esp]